MFGKNFFSEILSITGAVGARVVLKSHPEKIYKVKISDIEANQDIDTMKDLETDKNFAKIRLYSKKEN